MKRLVLSMVTIKPAEKAKEEKKVKDAQKQGKPAPPKKPVISKEELKAIQDHVQSEKFIAQVTKMFYKHDRDNSGYLDFEECKELMEDLNKKMAKAGHAIPNPNAETYHRRMLTVDSNNDGWINLKELVPFVQDWFIELAIFKEKEARKPPPPAWAKDDPLSSDDDEPSPKVKDDWKYSLKGADLKKISAHVDSDQFKSHALSMFRSFDDDNNGYLDENECKPIAKTMTDHLRKEGMDIPNARTQEIQRLLDTMDSNGDGKLDFNEFHFFMKRLVVALCQIKPAVKAEQKKAEEEAKAKGKPPPPKEKDQAVIKREEVKEI